jgi:hypothetical protein
MSDAFYESDESKPIMMSNKSCETCGWWDEEDGICTRITCKDYRLWKPRPEVEKP